MEEIDYQKEKNLFNNDIKANAFKKTPSSTLSDVKLGVNLANY